MCVCGQLHIADSSVFNKLNYKQSDAWLYQVLLSEFCVNGGTLPCDADGSARRRCITSTHLDRMWRVVDQHGRRDVTDAELRRASLLLVYPLLVDVVGRLTDMAAAAEDQAATRGSGTSTSRLAVYLGHDKTLAALLTALRLHDGRWPALGARVVFELAAAVTGSVRGAAPRYYFRLLYDGRDVTSRLECCGAVARGGACPLDNLVYSVLYHIPERFGSASSHARACAAR